MKNILNRYLIKEQLVPLGVCVLGLSLVLITGRLLQLTEYLFTSSATGLDIVELLALAMPKLMLYVLPMATLIGVVLAFVRLNSDNELTALRTAGVSFMQLLPSVLCVLLLVTSLSFWNAINIIPQSNQAFEVKLKSLGRASMSALLKENTFVDIIPKMVFFFRNVNTADSTVDGILVQDQRDPGIHLIIVAEHARVAFYKPLNQLIFTIQNGVITRVPDNLQDAQAVSFKVYDLTLSLDEIFGDANNIAKGRTQMTLRELARMVQTGADNKNTRRYELEIHHRLALPLSCLILGLVGVPLGALFRQKGRMTGVTLGLVVFIIYYVLLSAGKGLGENHYVPPFLAIWTPNMLAAVTAIYLWGKVHRETPFRAAVLWQRLTHFLLKRFRSLKSKYEDATSAK